MQTTGLSHTCRASTERRAQASRRCRAARVRLGVTPGAGAVPLYGAASHIAGAPPAAAAASNACTEQGSELGVDDSMHIKHEPFLCGTSGPAAESQPHGELPADSNDLHCYL